MSLTKDIRLGEINRITVLDGKEPKLTISGVSNMCPFNIISMYDLRESKQVALVL